MKDPDRTTESNPEASQALQASLRREPGNKNLWAALSQEWSHQGQGEQAIQAGEKALSHGLDNESFLEFFLKLLLQEGRPHRAQALLEEHPGYERAQSFKAQAFLLQGRTEEAVSLLERYCRNYPEDSRAASTWINTLHYAAGVENQEIEKAYGHWQKNFGEPGVAQRISRPPNTPLRIGFLSPDFRQHPISTFFYPVLKSLQAESVVCYAYSNVTRTDRMSLRIKESVQVWRDITSLDDRQAAELIRKDKIDILVDLAGHMGDYRLGVFLQKPALFQVSWLGYPHAGLPCIDFRITDSILDPETGPAWKGVEKPIRLNSSLCYQPSGPLPELTSKPRNAKEPITLGCFNNASKLNPVVLQTWNTILRQFPNTRLVLKAQVFSEPETAAQFKNRLLEGGISQKRIKLIGWTPAPRQHLELYRSVDIALDPFPYNGFTTTCEALVMGVPVVTLSGNRPLSRVSHLILNQIGREEWVGVSIPDYIEKVGTLISQQKRFPEWRIQLRKALLQGKFGDEKAFANNLLNAFIRIADTKAFCS